jgi:predicted ATPase
MPDLLVHRLCRTIDLPLLSEAEVEEYLGARSPAGSPPQGLSELVHRHSGGNPLFMVAALEHMAKRGLLTHTNGRWELQVPLEHIEFEVPDDLRHMIEAQLERLAVQEQSALELASIAGASFSASMVSSATDIDMRSLEDLFEELSRRHHIVKWAGTQYLPDGSEGECYEFVHVLYRQVLYDRQPPSRRARLHRQIGEQAAHIAGRRYAHPLADSILVGSLQLVSHLPQADACAHEAAAAALPGRTSYGGFRRARYQDP